MENNDNVKIEIQGCLVNIPVNTPDCNGRMYPKGVFEKALEEYKNKVTLENREKNLKDILKDG